ncbi:MAG: hypothetical protein HY426_00395 [Candidatus Levybacteria bacterium]|nr:hypothetical protein [Candidatus Levybacteria bacterium]
MQNKTPDDKDIKFNRKMRYIDLMFAKMKIEEELNYYYPEEMAESRKKLAQTMLKWGVIKCRHE